MSVKRTKIAKRKTFYPPVLTLPGPASCLRVQGAAAYPENEDQQQRLREAAEGLRVATNAAAQNAIKKKLINRLEVSRAIRDDQLIRGTMS